MAGGGGSGGGGGLQIPDFEDFPGFKGGGGGGSAPPGGTGGSPPGTTIFGPAGGAGSPFSGIGPSYDRSVPAFGYRRRPMGPVPNSRTAGAVAAPGGIQSSPYSSPQSAPQQQAFGGQSWYGAGPSPTGTDWTIPQYISNASGAGVFDPTGSQALLGAIGQQYGQSYGSAQRGVRNGLLAGGVTDPNAFAYGQLQGDLNQQGQYANALSNARLQSMLQNQGFLQNVFGQNQGYAQNLALQGTQQRFNQQLQNAQRGTFGDQLWGLAGQLGGAAIGAYTGRPATPATAQPGGLGQGTGSIGGVGSAPGYMQGGDYGWGGGSLAPPVAPPAAAQGSQWNPQFGPDPYAY